MSTYVFELKYSYKHLNLIVTDIIVIYVCYNLRLQLLPENFNKVIWCFWQDMGC